MQTLLSYTWGHSIDDVSSDVNYQNVPLGQSPPSAERGPSDYDIRHTFSGATGPGHSSSIAFIISSAYRTASAIALIVAGTPFLPAKSVSLRKQGYALRAMPTVPSRICGRTNSARTTRFAPRTLLHVNGFDVVQWLRVPATLIVPLSASERQSGVVICTRAMET